MNPDPAVPGGARRRPQRRRARHRARLGDRAQALRHRRLSSLLRPGERIARKGFRIDETFNQQVTDNADIFDDFTASRELYLTPARTAKPVGDVQRNPDMAETYERIGEDPDNFYEGRIARDIAQTVQHPPVAPDSDRPHPVHPGSMTRGTSRATRRSAASRRGSATAGSTSTAWPRRPPAARRSARR